MDDNPALENDHQANNSEPWDEDMARWYVSLYGDHPTNHKTVEAAGLIPGDCVLDIGCGSGTAVREAARLVTSGIIIGVDPSPAMIRIAKEKSLDPTVVGRIRFLVGSAERLPVETDTVTVALAINSVHHWIDLPTGLAEIRRVLRPGGRLIFGEEIVDDEADGSEERDYREDINLILPALKKAGYTDVALTQLPIAGGMMNILQAVSPKPDGG